VRGPRANDSRRELARRISGGVEVTLYWDAEDGNTSVELRQHAIGEAFAFNVPPQCALEAFHHPFDHLPRTGDDLIATVEKKP
jgi:hypothetical protein